MEQRGTLIFVIMKIRHWACGVYSSDLLTDDRLLTVACSLEGGMDSSKAINMSLFPERAHSWIGVSMDCNKQNQNCNDLQKKLILRECVFVITRDSA